MKTKYSRNQSPIQVRQNASMSEKKPAPPPKIFISTKKPPLKYDLHKDRKSPQTMQLGVFSLQKNSISENSPSPRFTPREKVRDLSPRNSLPFYNYDSSDNRFAPIKKSTMASGEEKKKPITPKKNDLFSTNDPVNHEIVKILIFFVPRMEVHDRD